MATQAEIKSIIDNSVVWAAGAGVIPIPIGDFIAVTAVQLDMLRRISKAYGKDYSEISSRSFILALNASVTARIGASLLKAIPGFGSVLGMISMPIMAGASTYAVGKVFTYYMVSSGSINDIDMDEAKDMFKEWYERGKERLEGPADKDKKDEPTTDEE